jgi:hypothetical protein
MRLTQRHAQYGVVLAAQCDPNSTDWEKRHHMIKAKKEKTRIWQRKHA